MTEPQVWTLIGVFAGAIGVIITLVITLMKNIATGLRTEMRRGFEAVGVRLDGLDSRVGRLETRFDHLERDVTALFRRDFGESL